MLSSLISKLISKSHLVKFYSLFIFFSLTISLSISLDGTCTEQWSEINLDQKLWQTVGDASANDNADTPFYAEFEAKDSTQTDIGGAVWHPYDFSKKRGILISFKPVIKPDESYTGNVKYPQGFAIVFTSSSIDNLLGEKGSGLGYEGIMNAIAFEFDFVKQTANGDHKKPHFSVMYNVNGAISASTKDRTDLNHDKPLPNFYDNSLDGYYKNINYEIEIVGKKLTVRNSKEGTVLTTDFPEFQELLEQDDVHIGITAAMNQNKKVTIEDFKVSEVSVNEKGNLEIDKEGDAPEFKAGEEITLLYSIKSTCGEKLKIYPDEYSVSGLQLIINNEEVSYEEISFDEDSVQLKIVVSETIENIYTALVNFQGQLSEPTKFIVTSSDINRLELCNPDETKQYYISPGFEQSLEYFYVPLCFYDQYGNRKPPTQTDMGIKIGYPENLLPDLLIETNIDEVNKQLIVKVPFNTFGVYKIFCEDFIESKVRYVNVMPEYISPENSEISILYEMNIVQDNTNEISLRIKPKDNYGRDIPNVTLKNMNCKFDSSFVINYKSNTFSITPEYSDDDYVLLKFNKPSDFGKYTFVPIVECNGIEETKLDCGINFETKINNCEFFNGAGDINSNYIQLFDEYSSEYKIFAKENNEDYLYISLDEKENKKLTEIILLDSGLSPSLLKTQTITSKLDDDNLDVISIGNKYAIVLPKTRDNYSPVNTHTLKIQKGSEVFNINVKFYSLDQYISNTDITYTDETKVTYKAFYKQNSLTVEASDILLLFEIYEMTENNHFRIGNNLKIEDVSLIIDDTERTQSIIIKHNSFISVSTQELFVAGVYKISLKYKGSEIIRLNIEIIPKKDVYYLTDESRSVLSSKTILINNEEHIRLLMADKYKNIIQNNEIFNAFSKIKISDMNIFDIRLDYKGQIHIYNQGKISKSITLTLIDGTIYTINSNYTPGINDLDPLNSYGLYKGSSILGKDESVEMYLYLRDKYGNVIPKNNFDKNYVDIYIEGKNIKKIVPMTLGSSISTDEISFIGTIEKSGDYEIKIFINNIPVECQACHFRKNNDQSADVTKSVLYILGNKQKIPVINSYKKENYKIGLVDKSTGYFSFYLDERDAYDNEYKETKTLTFTFESVGKEIDTTSISICPTGNNEDERNYFKLCSGVDEAWKQLPEGLYRLTALSETNIFYIYLTDNFYDTQSTEPDIKYSMVLSNKKEIYGKTDIPGSFILDLRTTYYKRIKNVEIEKITIKESTGLTIKAVSGPEKGLITIFLIAPKPGEYHFSIRYDGSTIIGDDYIYYCFCGFDKKLKYIGTNNFSNGNYALFTMVDNNNNECSQQYIWNDLNVKEYANNVFFTTENNYKFDTFYNVKSNTFIFYFDNHVNAPLTLNSNLFKFNDNDNSQSLDIITNILDENHFSVKYESNKLTITPLTANYEKAEKYNLNHFDIDIVLLRIINDDFIILKKDFTINSNLIVELDDSLMDSKGKYIYVTYYKGKELFCENCIIDKTENSVDMTKTKVYHKEGDNNYIQNDNNIIMPMIKTNLPFFKVNLFSENNNSIILESTSGLSITLKTESGDTIESNIKLATNGNIYVYLTTAGRNKYWSLASMTNIILTISLSGKSYTANYYVLDYPIKMPSSIEHCSTGAVPNIINLQDIYIKRYDEELELEIYLSDCAEEQIAIMDKLNIYSVSEDKSYEADLIPTDQIGGYLLFISKEQIPVKDASKYYIENNKAKSSIFTLSIIPGYEIKSVSFEKDNDMTETQSDKLYTYFMVELKDKNNNIITNEGRNLFINDINVLSLSQNLPYRFMYDPSKKAFRCQVPVNGFNTIIAQSTISSTQFSIAISHPKFLKNSLVTLESESSNKYVFSITLKDDFYKKISLPSMTEYKISFKYFTINPLTEEVFIREVSSSISENNYIINLSPSFPKYSIYGFIPYIDFLAQICPSCIIINKNPYYIYTIGYESYIPHNIEKTLFAIKDLDLPTYLYIGHTKINMDLTNINNNEIISTDNTKIYVTSSNQKNDIESVKITFKFDSGSKTFTTDFINYSQKTEIGNKETPSYIENFGYKVLSKNYLDNSVIEFFMENRDNSGKLITNLPNLIIDNDFSGIIKKIIVLNTCFSGIYYVKITFSTSANIEFYPKYNQEQKKDNYITIQLNIISAFPTDIVLNNKEIINKNIIKYNLVTSNSYSEQVCDERLNIYIDDLNLKNFKKVLVEEHGNCYLYVKFSGKAVIHSNINSFISEINNNDKTLYNINPQFSSLSIKPNVFTINEDDLEIKFYERTPKGITYEENEINENKNLYIYKFITPNKFQLIKSFSGLFSSSYPFNSERLNLLEGNSYIFIGDIVNNNIPPLFVHYKTKKSKEIKSIKANYFTKDKRSYKLSNFLETVTYSGDSLDLTLPLLLKVQLLDTYGNPLDIEYNTNNLQSEIILHSNNDIYIKIGLTVLQYNDNTFYIKQDTKLISDILHLPVNKNQGETIGFFIKLIYNENTNFYSLLNLKQSNLQIPSLKSTYNIGIIDLEYFEAKTYHENSMMHIPKGIPNIQQICLYISKDGQSGPIINEHLDMDEEVLKVQLEGSSSCDFTYANSYMGCFEFSTTCEEGKLVVSYKGKTSSTKIEIKSFSSTQFSSISFDESNTKNTRESTDKLIQLKFNNIGDVLDPDFYKVFVNGERYEKTSMIINSDNIQLETIDKVFTSIQKEKNVMVIYDTGSNVQNKLMSKEFNIKVIQKNYDPTTSNYKAVIQETFDLKVGDLIYFYILLYDSDKACYYGDFENLQNMRIKMTIGESNLETNINERIPISGYSQCEYIYKVQFTEASKLAGNFAVNVQDQEFKYNTKIYIAPKEIADDKASFSGENNVKAGQTLYLKFSGTDSEGNSINYYDLIKEFDIELIDSKNKIVEKKESNYKYSIRVNSDNTALNISLKINHYDTFIIKAIYNGKEMNLKTSFKINVKYGQCSMKDPNPLPMPIDNRNEYYIGETITIHFQCKDALGNVVEVEENEIFTANIRQILDDNTEVKYDYTKTFDSGNHYISFTPSKIGKYSIDISLNGKKYGRNNIVEILPTNRNKIHCMNKKKVDKFIDCDADYQSDKTYRTLVQEILGDSYSCFDNDDQGKIYKCFSNDECVTDTINCGCLGDVEKRNGYCYPNNYDPIKQVSNNKASITCINKLKALYPDTEVFLCDDGTCRFSEQECLTNFECPLGYRSCGNKCILLSESCSIEASCSSGYVLCWDLTCAKNYDLCPTRITCPKDKILCPDGTCQLSGHCIQPLTRSCSEGQYQCSDFSCVNKKEDCKKNPVCDVGLSLCENGLCQKSCQDVTQPDDKFRCPNGQFVDNSKLCPSEIFVPSGYVKCSNGGIAKSFNDCSYTQGGLSITCPNIKPILCPDLSCVSQSSECNTDYIPSCPPHKPYQCWNNECRKSFDECPTPVKCPSDSPVLCQNGFCAKSSDECKEKTENNCSKNSKYRCFEGTCVSSMELCPTHSYCGKDQIKCWNGACVSNIDECRSTELDSCPSTFSYRCPDGSCRGKYDECSTVSVCPPSLPIKCFDNSCRASIDECPVYQSCGENKVSCPDGTCALSYEECNTVVTCLSGSPFLCYDNTCKSMIDDCPLPPKCSKNEVLCPNGACASSRQNCKIFDPCESIYPIKCETNICTDDLNKCSNLKRCPEGYVLCDNGECKSSGYLCEKFDCPKNKPYKCDEGICVHDKSLCDKANGCPYNKEFKCANGTCVSNEKDCIEYSCSGEGVKLCPDGSCINEENECPLENGCYKDRRLKCADGTCINPETTSCAAVLCPIDNPYKCPNGNCVPKSSDCSKNLFENELEECGNGLIMCADGRCVESSDYCRPMFKCESPYEKCPDGTCRVSLDICPTNAEVVKCPESRPYRCDTHCAKKQEDCKDGYICPNSYHKCPSDGLCKESRDECRQNPNTDNICAVRNKKMCKNGRCLSNVFDCDLVSEACPDNDKPYLCPNGECTDNLSTCKEVIITNNEICEKDQIMCSSGRCVENKPEILRTQCTNNIGCPLDKPYRCSNGECTTSSRKCEVTSLLDNTTFTANIICDSSKPYLCADKTCVSDTSFCKVALDCPEGMTKCDNSYCIKAGETCAKFSGFCPSANPIQCPSGTCVDDIIKCTTSFNIPKCSEGEFYCLRMNKCMKNKLECLLYMENMIEKNETKYNNMRFLYEDENIVNPLKDEEYIKLHKYKLKSLKEEGDDKDKETEKIEGTLCYDGSIATGDEKCPIVPACKIGEYRCENGACASDKSLCPVDETYICLDGQQKCPDGFCHKNCSEVAFHGCEVNKYQCSNGQCLDDKYDCIGYSMCPDPAFPFRCITGECKSDPEDCDIIERLGSVKNLTYSYNKLNKIGINFAFDMNSRTVGYLEIPSNGLIFEGNYSKLYIEEVSSSLLKDSELYNNTAEFLFNVSNSIIGSEGLLNFENSVMSPVFKFYSKEKNIKFKFPGIINIAHNEYESSAFYYYDYCLAKLKGFDLDKDKINKNDKERGWECIERQTEDGQSEFQISEFGVYAVILNPLRNKINYFVDSTAKNFFFENVKIILIVLGVIIVIIAIVFYIFLRVTRYRKKYHANREKILLLKQQREEYENMTTDIFGQTLGDNINGIVYKSNPAYTVTDEVQKASGSLEDEIERLQIECKNVNEQNERLQKNIAEITKKYEQLSESIENMNK